MTVGEARASLASPPQRGGRYLGALTPWTEALEDTEAVGEAKAAAIMRVADAMETLKAVRELMR
jgi:hypothetical protein